MSAAWELCIVSVVAYVVLSLSVSVLFHVGNCWAKSNPWPSIAQIRRKSSDENRPIQKRSKSDTVKNIVDTIDVLSSLLEHAQFRLVSAQLSLSRLYPFTYFFQSSFRAVSEQFQSSFRAVSDDFQSIFRAVSEDFQSSFRAVSEQFQSSFRGLSEQFQRTLRAVSEQWSNLGLTF